MKAIWNDTTIAESDDTVVVEGNHYFPMSAVNMDYLAKSDKTSFCPWKGTASYFSIKVDGEVNSDSAWHYPKPNRLAKKIKDHVAFWHGVAVVE